MHKLFLTVCCLIATATQATAEPCRETIFSETNYVICSFGADADIRIFWRNDSGAPYRTFTALAAELTGQGKQLAFAMNGGMYQPDLSPVGLLVIDGVEHRAANTTTLPADIRPIPNFYKTPNGIFFITADKAGVLTTESYLAQPPEAIHATQSGPMLVIDGDIHAAFIPGSSDRTRRDGICVSGDGTTHFAISQDAVNFNDFALLFRDHISCQNALFLDGGSAPGIYAPQLDRDDRPGHGGYGPIIGVVADP